MARAGHSTSSIDMQEASSMTSSIKAYMASLKRVRELAFQSGAKELSSHDMLGADVLGSDVDIRLKFVPKPHLPDVESLSNVPVKIEVRQQVRKKDTDLTNLIEQSTGCSIKWLYADMPC